MIYLKFLSKENIHSLGDYFQMNFTFVINDSPNKINKSDDIKSIEVRLTGREDASLRAQYSNYELETAFFTIAKNYIIGKIESGKSIQMKEKVFPDASEYLYLDSELLEIFHNEEIEVETN